MASYVGKCIYLDWTKTELKAWCAAKVLSFKPNTQKHEVQFEDGEREWVDLLSGGGRQWTEKLPKKVWKNKERCARRLAKEYGIKLEMSAALVDVAEELLNMEDRLPNEGVKSQQPRFWESLRKQILRCQTPKVMAAAVIKFAAQVKDCVVMQDWENKAADWTALVKQAATEEDVAEVVRQVKYEMVNWSECRALFPSIDNSKPLAAPVKKAPKKAETPARSPEPGVAVECNQRKGTYQPQSHVIVCWCPSCHGQQELTPSAWERHVGCRSHNWRKSIKLANTVGNLFGWLSSKELSPQGPPAATRRVVSPSKVLQLPPHSATRLQQEASHGKTGQLLLRGTSKRKSRGQDDRTSQRGKRKLNQDEAASNSNGEGTFENRPTKRAARSSTAQKTETMRESEQDGETMGQREEHDKGAQLMCIICEKCEFSHDILLCDGDECGRSYHTYCLTPQLQAIPEGDWFCPSCVSNKPTKKTSPGTKHNAMEHVTARGRGSPNARSEPPTGGLGFFQTLLNLFNEGPLLRPLSTNTDPQDDCSSDQPEKCVAAQRPAKSKVVLRDPIDDDDEALLAFNVAGSAYAAKVGR